jgi:hypothetical protein
MARFLISSAIFLVGLVIAVLIMVAPALRDVVGGKATGMGIVVSPLTVITAVCIIVVVGAFSVWLSGRIMHALNR